MSKENINKPSNPGQAYPVGQEDLEKQQQRLSNAAAAGAGVLPPSGSPPTPAKSTAASAEKPPGAQAASKPAATPSQAPQPAAPLLPRKTAVASAPPKPAPVQAPPPPAPSRPVAAATGPKKAGAQAQSQPAIKKVMVNFAFVKPGAKAVSLCGEFNGWSPTAMPMKPREDGRWETTLALSPGKYEYKFLVDGEWIPDPAAQKSVANQFGSLNSVLEIRA